MRTDQHLTEYRKVVNEVPHNDSLSWKVKTLLVISAALNRLEFGLSSHVENYFRISSVKLIKSLEVLGNIFLELLRVKSNWTLPK
jgi:hypothetical protein